MKGPSVSIFRFSRLIRPGRHRLFCFPSHRLAGRCAPRLSCKFARSCFKRSKPVDDGQDFYFVSLFCPRRLWWRRLFRFFCRGGAATSCNFTSASPWASIGRPPAADCVITAFTAARARRLPCTFTPLGGDMVGSRADGAARGLASFTTAAMSRTSAWLPSMAASPCAAPTTLCASQCAWMSE